jgi:hypothetical protein
MLRTHIAAIALVGLSAAAPVHAQHGQAAATIKTPFSLVPLWSEDMMEVLTGTAQSPCSGVDSNRIERLETGGCAVTSIFPLYESPFESARSLGALVVKVIPGVGILLAYRPEGGDEISFVADWTVNDIDYTFLLDQTIVDRHDDWYRLPRRPFPRPVWVRLPNRGTVSRVSPREIYTLAHKVKARRKGTRRSVTLEPDDYFIIRFRDGAVEMRNEEPGDMDCGDVPPTTRPLPAYVVDARDLHDSDLHLLLKPAYTRGC